MAAMCQELKSIAINLNLVFPGGSVVKNLLVNPGDLGSIPVLRRSPGEGNGLSRVEAGNPGFPRLVQVTSGGFSWWL